MEGLLNSDTRNDINIAILRFDIDTKKWLYLKVGIRVKSLLWNKQLFLSSSFHRRMVPGKATSTVGARWLAQKGYAPDLCLESLGCFFCVSSLLKKMWIYGTFCEHFFMPRERQYIFGPLLGGRTTTKTWRIPGHNGSKQIIGWANRHQPPWLLKATTSARSLPSCSLLIVFPEEFTVGLLNAFLVCPPCLECGAPRWACLPSCPVLPPSLFRLIF